MNIKSIKMNKDFLIPGGFGTLFVCENIISDDKTITLSPGYDSDLNISFKVLFKNGHVKTTNEHMTLNELPIVVNKYGNLIPIPNHKIVETENYYYTMQANTILEMYYTDNYDGNNNPAFVVVGNPVVLSSVDYTIYADGKVGDDIIGTVKAWSSTNVPYGWEGCDGRTVSRSRYSELLTLFSTHTYDGSPINEHPEKSLLNKFGVGDGSTTFKMPDFRECALTGIGSNGTFSSNIRVDDIYWLGDFKDDALRNHYHDRGNMQISGTFIATGNPNGLSVSGAFGAGAPYASDNGSEYDRNPIRTVDFYASRAWSGYTGGTRNADYNNAYELNSSVTRGKRIGINYIIKGL